MNTMGNGNRELHLPLTDQKSKGDQPDILPAGRLVNTTGGAQEPQFNNPGTIKEFGLPTEYQTLDERRMEIEKLKERIWKGLDEFKNQSWKDEEWKEENRREANEEGENWKDENGNNEISNDQSWKEGEGWKTGST